MKKTKALKDRNITAPCFSEATVNCLRIYIQPMIDKKQQDKVVMHEGTNELSTDKSSSTIALDTVVLEHKYCKEKMEIISPEIT